MYNIHVFVHCTCTNSALYLHTHMSLVDTTVLYTCTYIYGIDTLFCSFMSFIAFVHFTETTRSITCTDATVKFVVTLTQEKMAEAEKVGFHKKFKLESSMSTTNLLSCVCVYMYVFV